MLRSRPPRAALLGVLLVTVLAACSGQGADADPTEGPTGSESVVSDGASPVVFAFECDDGGDRERYTTYSAVWEAERSSCTAHRLTGSVPSEQQQAAVRAADGAATLVELAATCADTGTAPWTTEVTTRRGAQLAAALLRYCPGHPETDHLRDALSTYRG